MKLTVGVLLVALCVSCTSPPPPPVKEEGLSRFLLSAEDAPVNTRLDGGSSGPQTLAQYAEDDKAKLADFGDAGFETSYFNVFLSKDAFDAKAKNGSIAISFAILFKTEAGAKTGVRLIEKYVRRDGTKLEERTGSGLGDDAFALAGALQTNFPPGFLFAWRHNNVVLGLIAAGPAGVINQDAARALAERMYAKRDS